MTFNYSDVKIGMPLRVGDEVKIDVVIDKRQKRRYAVNIAVTQPAPTGREQGIVEQVKEGFGFIDAFGEHSKLFFHASNVLRLEDGTVAQLGHGTEVEFDIDVSGQERRAHAKANAMRITVLPPNTITFVQVLHVKQRGFIQRAVESLSERGREGGPDRPGRLHVELNKQPHNVFYGLHDIGLRGEKQAAEDKVYQNDKTGGVNGPSGLPPAFVPGAEAAQLRCGGQALAEPLRSGEEVCCDVCRDKREPNVKYAQDLALAWTEGVVTVAPRTGSGFGKVEASGRDPSLSALKFHWSEQLANGDAHRIPLHAGEAVCFVLTRKQQMSGHFESGANRLVRLSAPSEAALAAFTAEQATLAKQQQQRHYSGGDGIGSESGEDAAPDPRVNSKLARGPDGTRGFHSRTGPPFCPHCDTK